MDEPWKVVRTTSQSIELQHGPETMALQRPSNPAARAMFMQIRPGEQIDEAMIHYLLTVGQGKQSSHAERSTSKREPAVTRPEGTRHYMTRATQ